VPLAIGSDSQVRIDPFEEARELETLSRRERETRSGLLAAHRDLWATLAHNGQRSLGLDALAEVEIDMTHPDLRGVEREDLPAALVASASAGVVRRRALRVPAAGPHS
jgi:formimidoylglutamate deiminase